MTPTPEQSAILDFVQACPDNLMIRAYAGTGKTHMLTEIDKACGTNPKLLICFNKSIATEATSRVLPSTTVKTFNSLGHRVWADACGKRLTLEKSKILNIYRAIADETSAAERSELWSYYDLVSSGVNLARAIGYIPPNHAKASKALTNYHTLERLLDETPSPDAHALIDKILNISIKQAYDGLIDFNDQVYMPALFSGAFPQFPLVMIDEYQDLSPVNHAMVAKLCRRSRQIGVGDECQAIYGFRGAAASSMSDAIDRFSMSVLPLSVTFRCPSNIVQNVLWRVPDYKSIREGGLVENLSEPTINDDSTVICRNNAPLLKQAMRLLIAGHSVDVAGVDVGARIIKTMTKLGPESLTRAQTLSAIDDWQAERESLDSKSAPDLAECMRVFAKQATTLGGAIAYIRHMFALSGGKIKFMTGHKAKGLEFDHVYHLDSDLLSLHGQDPNIHYVIDTRPKERLSYIRTENM